MTWQQHGDLTAASKMHSINTRKPVKHEIKINGDRSRSFYGLSTRSHLPPFHLLPKIPTQHGKHPVPGLSSPSSPLTLPIPRQAIHRQVPLWVNNPLLQNPFLFATTPSPSPRMTITLKQLPWEREGCPWAMLFTVRMRLHFFPCNYRRKTNRRPRILSLATKHFAAVVSCSKNKLKRQGKHKASRRCKQTRWTPLFSVPTKKNKRLKTLGTAPREWRPEKMAGLIHHLLRQKHHAVRYITKLHGGSWFHKNGIKYGWPEMQKMTRKSCSFLSPICFRVFTVSRVPLTSQEF